MDKPKLPRKRRISEDGSLEDYTLRIEYLKQQGKTKELEEIKKLKGWIRDDT
jgi:hypothetical protein